MSKGRMTRPVQKHTTFCTVNTLKPPRQTPTHIHRVSHLTLLHSTRASLRSELHPLLHPLPAACSSSKFLCLSRSTSSAPCLFNFFIHQHNSDTLRHFYHCPPITHAARTLFNQPNLPHDRNYFYLCNDYSSMQYHSIPALCLNAMHIYCITNTYHAFKHHHDLDPTSQYHASLKRLLQYDPSLITTFKTAQRKRLY